MPAFNEASTIATTVLDWIAEFRAHFEDYFRLVVVNDGSSDETGEVLDTLARGNPELSIIHLGRQGHGQAVLAGYRVALALNPAYIFQTDSDGRHRPADFRAIWESRRYSRFVLGDREIVQHPGIRIFIHRLLTSRALALFGCRIPDPGIPYRLMESGYLESLLQGLPHQFLAPNLLLAILAQKAGEDLVNIPVSYQERRASTWRGMHLRTGWLALRSLFQLLVFRVRVPTNVAAIQTPVP